MLIDKLVFPYEQQFEILNGVRRYANITKAANSDSGIEVIEESRQNELVSLYDKFVGSVTKFVPASGAASRMFKHLHDLSDESPLVVEFLDQIEEFPFFRYLDEICQKQHECSVRDLIKGEKYRELSNLILSSSGLGFSSKPKGMIPFHLYNDEIRNPFQEQVIEGLKYAVKNKEVNFHFTVPPLHETSIRSQLKDFSEKFKEEINISYSVQNEATNTIALNREKELVKDEHGEVLLRPGGHGALIYNLNKIESDLIFIKNIDNVVKDADLDAQSRWKKILAGTLLEVRNQVYKYHHQIDKGSYSHDEIKEFLLQKFGYEIPDINAELLLGYIDKPIRVCGMVLNEGEPGGGPYYVDNNGVESLQIVESAEIDKQNELHFKLLRSSSHFNPVDLVCSVRDYKGGKYDLIDFTNPTACFTSFKDYCGEEIKILELPGLWNGAMAKWNTIFVEVPASTFNPVKTVNDLLKSSHKV